MIRPRWPTRALLAVAALSACSSRAEDARTLRLLQIRPEDASGVFLNERLAFHFSEPLDRTSVTARSVRILARDGRGTPARGRLRVSGRTLVFEPDPVLSPALDDGGYLPGTTYDVELAGFPRPEGLRGRSGAPLAETVAWQFGTVAVDEPRSGFVFEDATLDRGLPLVLRSEAVAPGSPIVLEGEEPIDPSTLHAADFVLRQVLRDERGARVRPPQGPPIPLRARLVDNRDRHALGEPGQTTRVELQPLERLEPGEQYWLQVDPSYLRLRDFGGHRVLVLDASGGRRLTIDVVPSETAAGTYLEHTETFIDDQMRSPEQVPGVDGTVYWGTSGRAELRLPAASGTGVDGALELDGVAVDFDLHGTRLAVPAGATARLSPVPGLVVLRAQGRIDVEGTLLRRSGAAPFQPAELFRAGETLSQWLHRAREAETDCTVLIAGGDLAVPGRIDVDGPLLLVAGGQLRVPGADNLAAAHAVKLAEGFALYDLPRRGNQPVGAAPLALDLAAANALAAPLVFGVRSAPIPRDGAAGRWHPGPRVGRYDGAGAARVRFLGERTRPDGTVEALSADDPAALDGSPTLRLELRLEVFPGEVWDPPWIDSVQVRWDPEGAGWR